MNFLDAHLFAFRGERIGRDKWLAEPAKPFYVTGNWEGLNPRLCNPATDVFYEPTQEDILATDWYVYPTE